MALDTQAIAARALQSPPYDAEAERYEAGPFPFSEIRALSVHESSETGEGRPKPRLQIRALMTPEGHAWLDPIANEALSGALEGLLEWSAPYDFQSDRNPPDYAFRGRPWARSIMAGVRRLPAVMRVLVAADPKALEGSLVGGATLELPSGPLPKGKDGHLENLDGIAPLRTELSSRAHRLELRVDGDFVRGELRPK
jgi:hypothetical protein